MSEGAALSFDPLRPRLTRIAYRMLGSVADAEDVVQDAFLRWLGADRGAVLEPEAFLRRVVTRLCLDQIKSARARRETYVGPWLPEPIVEEEEVDDFTLPLMLALERLSPLERAAFLLHDVFGASFDEVAETLEREPVAVRQLASRARAHVRAARPRFTVAREKGLEIAAAFFAASRGGDMTGLRALLAADASVYSDGGGKVHAGLKPIFGADNAMKLFTSLHRFMTFETSKVQYYGVINGLPGLVTREPGDILQTTAFLIGEEGIEAIYIVRNPEKLSHLEAVH